MRMNLRFTFTFIDELQREKEKSAKRKVGSLLSREPGIREGIWDFLLKTNKKWIVKRIS